VKRKQPTAPGNKGDSGRTAAGQFAPGRSGNPAGRPPGRAGLAAYLREKTSDGRDLADKALSLVGNPEHRDHMRAIEWVDERMFGKLPQTMAVGSPEEVERWKAIAENAEKYVGLSKDQLAVTVLEKVRPELESLGYVITNPTDAGVQ